MDRVTIEQEHKLTEFDGEKIAGPVSTRGDSDRPRWMELTIWRHANGGYVLYRLGHSNVYHQPGETIYKAGLMVGPDMLPDDAIPCHESPRPRNSAKKMCLCHPPWPEDLGDDDKVLLETKRHTVDRCATVADVIGRLTNSRRRGTGGSSDSMSDPVKELLADAVANDDGFRDYFSGNTDKPVEQLT